MASGQEAEAQGLDETMVENEFEELPKDEITPTEPLQPSLSDIYPLDLYPPDPHIPPSMLPNPLPPAPSKLDATDPLQLGIYYHEADDLVLSAHFLSISARQGHPVGMYLFAMALRHGFGCSVDMEEAVRLFEECAGAVLGLLPGVAGRAEGGQKDVAYMDWIPPKEILNMVDEPARNVDNISTTRSSPTSTVRKRRPFSTISLSFSSSRRASLPTIHSDPPSPPSSTKSKGKSKAKARPFSLLLMSSDRRFSTSLPTSPPLQTSPTIPLTPLLHNQSTTRKANLSVTRTFLPLPLYELGTCYANGWGVPKSKSTALYYWQLAAQLGDADAAVEVGYCFLQGWGVKRSRWRAAKWLRKGVEGGRRLVGEGWIWEERWGAAGDGDDERWERKKGKRRKKTKEDKKNEDNGNEDKKTREKREYESNEAKAKDKGKEPAGEAIPG